MSKIKWQPMNQYNPCDLQVQLDKYVTMVQEKVNTYWEAMGYTHATPPNVTVDYGRKYARIVSNDSNGAQRTVHTFVNMLNGDILKSGSWAAPQKNGVRGNIFSDDLGADRINEYGANYLR